MGQSPQIVRQYYEAKDLMDSLRYKLTEEKTLNYLIKNARVLPVERELQAVTG
jgi:hypothetical protein